MPLELLEGAGASTRVSQLPLGAGRRARRRRCGSLHPVRGGVRALQQERDRVQVGEGFPARAFAALTPRFCLAVVLRQGGGMLAIVAPGQGAQTPGFLEPWLELPAFAARIGAASQVAGIDLVELGTTGDAEQISDTAVAQPLLVAAGLAALGELLGPPRTRTRPCGGRRARRAQRGRVHRRRRRGCAQPEAAMALVADRGKAMAEASAVTPTGMTAVLGGDRDEVLAAIAEPASPRPTTTAPARSSPRAPRPSSRRSPRPPPGEGPADPAVGRGRVPHRAHGPGRRAAGRAAAGAHPGRPGHHAAHQRRRHGGGRPAPTRWTGW